MTGLTSPTIGGPRAEQSYIGFSKPEQPAHEFFGVSNPADMMADLNRPPVRSFSDFIHGGPPKPSEYSLDLARDVVADLTHLNTLNTTFTLGRQLYEGSKAIEESGKDKTEAIACEIAKAAAETLVSAGGTGLIIGGMTAIVTESIACPPMAVAIPIAAAAIPDAYANVQHTAKFAGERAEAACHDLFSRR